MAMRTVNMSRQSILDRLQQVHFIYCKTLNFGHP